MTRRKGAGARSPGDYEVGYAKPPIETQFKPGNPGRRKGASKKDEGFSMPAIVRKALAQRIRVKRGDQTASLSLSEVVSAKIVQMITQGTSRDFALGLELLARYAPTEFEDLRVDIFHHQAPSSTVPLPPAGLGSTDEDDQ